MAKKNRKWKVKGTEVIDKALEELPEEEREKVKAEILEKLSNDPLGEGEPGSVRKICGLPEGSKFCPRDCTPLKQVGEPFRWRDEHGVPDGDPVIPLECPKCLDVGYFVAAPS